MNGELIKRLLTDLDVSYLIDVIDDNDALWSENTWRQNYTVQGERPVSPQEDTEAIMFRWAPENKIESVRDSLDVVEHVNFQNIPQLRPLLLPCLDFIEATELGRVFIAKLKPGGRVIAHRDYGKYANHFERFHVVLSSDDGNEFFVEDSVGNKEGCHMRVGELYWFNHKEIHWAVNNSKRARMHLIIDAVAPKYRRERGIQS